MLTQILLSECDLFLESNTLVNLTQLMFAAFCALCFLSSTSQVVCFITTPQHWNIVIVRNEQKIRGGTNSVKDFWSNLYARKSILRC